MKNPINRIILEGPDLSGKTTLYNQIHKASNFRWNVQDRSALSMLVYAKLYGRPEFTHVENLNQELNDLNNQVIILLPDWSTIVARYNTRGDELQNFISLRKVYNFFEEAAGDLIHLPNVTVIRKEVDDFVLSDIIESFHRFESAPFASLSNNCLLAASTGKNLEKVGLRLTSYDHGRFDDVVKEDLQYESEKVYYDDIKRKVLTKITDELSGINEYFRVESIDSRRFIYTSDTCISLAHFMYRDRILNAKYFLRSSNTRDTLRYDLNFLKYLSKCVFEKLDLPKGTLTKMEVLINSAHVPGSIDSNQEQI